MKKTEVDIRSFCISRFLRLFKRDKIVALFHQLHPAPIYLQETTWHNFESNLAKEISPSKVSNLILELVSKRLLINNQDVDRQEFDTAREQILQKVNRPTILYLMMAQGCNFTCAYCPIPNLAKSYGEKLLSFDDAVAGIVLWEKHIEDFPPDNDSYFLIFYGGEPLLNWEVIERLLPYIDEEQAAGHLPQSLEMMLCTNGSLVDDSTIKILFRYRVMVAVKVDGPPKDNDSTLLTGDGNYSFRTVRQVIERLVENGVKVVASVIITPANVSFLSDYPRFLQEIGITKFGFNLMKGKALLRALNGRSPESYFRAAAKGVLSGLANLTDNGKLYEYQLEKKLLALQNCLPFAIDCTCYGNQIVIQPDGQVSNCPFLRFDQGHVHELPIAFRIGHTETMKVWRKRLPLLGRPIEADDNSVLDGGGCVWNSFELYGDIAAEDKGNTIFTKEVMYELVWMLLPKEKEEALRQGKITHWSYRRIGDKQLS